MLEPDSRVVLLDQLRPPYGYRLHAAVATTFTLDLTTAVVPPLAFASFEIRTTPDPVAALEAVRACTDRVDLFCQAGQIMVPGQHSDLMAYLEPMIHPVHRPKPGFLFHPKVWFLDYRAEGQQDRYRLLCSTRNLTQSGAWDAVVTLDGVRGAERRPMNTPLSVFVDQLPKQAVRALPDDRRARIETLAQAAQYVEWDRPGQVDEIAFHVFGLPDVDTAPDFSGYRHLVVSPFCNDAGVAHVSGGNTRDVTLVSRAEALDQLAPETLRHAKSRILDPLAVLNNPADTSDRAAVAHGSAATQGTETDTLYGLHAKITVVERARRGHVFIGSPNATSAAYGGNVEFAVQLSGGATKLGVDSFLGTDGETGLASLLMEYAADGGSAIDPADELISKLSTVLRALAEVPLTLTVCPGRSGFDLVLTSKRPIHAPAGHEIRAELLTSPGVVRRLLVGESVDATFPNIPLPDVTPFVVLRAKDLEHSTAASPIELSTVVHAALVDDPPDRLDAVLARQVDTPEKFLRFLALLLGLADATSLLGALDNQLGDGAWGVGPGGGVFELVVNALSERPESIRDLDTLVRRLQRTDAGMKVLPVGFETLWESVTEALTTIEREES